GKALADIDLDGYVEIISIGGENSLLVPSMTKVFAFEHDGTFKWESEQVAERYTLDGLTAVKGDGSVNGTLDGAEPTIADLDQDGTPEIIVGHGVIAAIGQQSGLAVTVFDNQGMKLFTSYARGADIQAGGSFMRAEVVDLDLDGDPEILVGSAAFSHDGELLWTVDGLKNDSRRATPLAVNLDDDPFPELIRAGTTDSEIVALNHDGSNFWDEPASTVFNFQTFEAELVIADVEDDGLVDILAVGNNGFSAGKLEVLNGADGSLKWDYPSDASGLNVGVVSPTVFDLNGDGNQEVLLFGYQPRTLWVLAGDTGQLIQEFDLELGNPSAFEAPIFADVDNDGASELLINGTFRFFGAMSAYWVFESPDDNWAPTRSIWNQWNYHVTNVNPDGTIPRFEQPHWLVSGLNQNRLNGRLPEERVEENDSFEYAASDGQLASNIARVDITVLPPNAPPRIVSTPRLLASPNFEYIYPVLAVDADPGETLIVSVANGPDGMVIDALNQVTWTPTTDDLGPHVVVLDVVDSLGTRSSQTFTIEVVPPVAVPDLSGRTEAEAVTDLNAVTLEASPILDSFSDTVPAGDVMTQDPSPNTTVAAGSSVSVEISRGQIPVAVPRVLGLNLDEAQADLAISGLATGSVVWVNDPLIPRDSILAQDPPPNALIAPNSAVDLTVSGGPRAVIVLDPPVITSGKSAAVSVEVRDVDGTPLDPQPTLSLSLASDPGSSFGTLPVLSGFSITTSPDTQGAFELGVSYSAPDPESISAEFAVLGPISDGIQGDLYSRFSRQQQQFGVLIEQLITAVDQGDSAAIAALDADLAALAEAIDLRRLRTMIAIAPDGGALPTPEQAAALGTGNQDSAYLDTSLELVALLEVMESVVLDSNTPDRVLSQLNQDLAAAAAALASLEPSVPGILRANGAITALTGTLAPRLLVADIQAVRQALVDQGLNSGQTTQRKAGRFSLPGIMIASQIRQNIITNFYVPYLGQAARMLGAVIAADLLQTYANFGAISGIITGASQSIHVFGIQPSVIEGLGFDPTLSPNNAVIMVGPALLNAVSNAASALSSARSIKDVNSAFDAINGILDAADGLNDAWNDANSIPMGVVRGCILDNNPACSQLVYPDGFTSVY
ncbi:MAG: PASTA domain-containing protein, partial [Wenzhouxiangella sp.]|nr:PASTA domain-containing protein [Wenzhouxiangella sp.]